MIYKAEVNGGELKFKRTERLEGCKLSVQENRLLNDTVTMFGSEANVDEVNKRLLEVKSRRPWLNGHEAFILACAGVQYENAKPDFPSLEYVLNWRMPHYYKIDTSKLVKNLKAPPEMKRGRGRPRKKLPIDEIVIWYVVEKKSTYQITKKLRELGYKISRDTVRRRLSERGVLRDNKTALKLANQNTRKFHSTAIPLLKPIYWALWEGI